MHTLHNFEYNSKYQLQNRRLFGNEKAQLCPSGLISPNRESFFSAAAAIKAEKPQKLPRMCSKRQLSTIFLHPPTCLCHRTQNHNNYGRKQTVEAIQNDMAMISDSFRGLIVRVNVSCRVCDCRDTGPNGSIIVADPQIS